MESLQLTRIVAASPVAVQIVQYMRLSTEPVELLLEVYVGWYYSNQGLLILSTMAPLGRSAFTWPLRETAPSREVPSSFRIPFSERLLPWVMSWWWQRHERGLQTRFQCRVTRLCLFLSHRHCSRFLGLLDLDLLYLS